MGEPRLSSVSSRLGVRTPGESDKTVIEGRSTIGDTADRAPLRCTHRRRIPTSRRTRGASALVSNLYQLDGRDLFVALNLIAGEFRSDPYVKPQDAITSNPLRSRRITKEHEIACL
jgi:hypothetical protein